MKKLFSIILLFFTIAAFSQNRQTDSLEAILKKATGKEKVEVLNRLAFEYRLLDPDQTKLYAIEALSNAESLNDKGSIGKSFQSMAYAYYYSGDIARALRYDQKALLVFKEANLKTEAAEAMVNVAFDYNQLGKKEKALAAYLNAIEYSEKIEYWENVAIIKKYLGTYYSDIGDYKQSIAYYKDALDYRLKFGSQEQLVYVQNEIGLVYWDLADYEQALFFFQAALETSNESNFVEGKAIIFNNIGNLYADWGNYNVALEHYNKTIELNRKLSSELGIAIAYNNIGEVYQEMQQFDSAKYYYEKSLKLKRMEGDSVMIANTLLNIAGLSLKEREYTKAMDTMNVALKVYRKNKLYRSEALTLQGIAKIHLAKGKYKEAIDYLTMSNEIAEKIEVLDDVKENYYIFFQIYEGLKDYKKALEFHQKYLAVKDTLFNEKSQKKILAFQTKYETQKKEVEIQLLKKDQVLQSVKQKNLKNISVGVGVILLVIALFIYSRNRVIKNANFNLEKKNQEIYQQKELLNEKGNLLDTTIKQLEKSNKELEKLSIVARETDNAIIIADADGYIEWVNQGFTRMYGYSYQEFIEYKGETLIESISDFDIKNKIEVSTVTKKPVIYDTLHLTKNGDVLWVQTVLTPILNENEEITRIIAIETDITKIKKAEEEARSARLAEESNRSKSEFLANMSHEIRTPLNAIIGFAKLLLKEDLSKKGKEFVETIHGNGNMLLTLINDILDLSKIESERMQIKKEPVSIKSVFKDTVNVFSIRAKEKGLNLQLDINEDIPTLLMLDEKRVRQVLINLIGNAIKFTDDGHVQVYLDFNKRVDNPKLIDMVFKVEDTGIGIDNDKKDAIFEAFKQQSGTSDRKYSGTGLGLTLTKRFVEAMGGNIQLESTKGKGTSFIVTIFDVLIVNAVIATESNVNQSEVDGSKNIGNLKDIQIYRSIIAEDIKTFAISDEDEIIEFHECFIPINKDCESIKKSPKINQIKKFAKSLTDVGKKYKLNGLIELGNDLYEEASRFKIKNMRTLLSYYTELYETIKTKVEE